MALIRLLRRALPALALLLLLAAAGEAVLLARASRVNSAISAPDADLSGDAPAERVFARAFRAAQRGDNRAALADYRQVIDGTDDRLAVAALYNAGNLHLREALRLRTEQETNPSVPLIELAKQSYREALRRDPQHWDSRYNLERALRLAPESEETDPEHLPPPPPRERAMTTMKGYTLGLP